MYGVSMNKEFLEEIIKEKISESDTLEFKDFCFTDGKLNSLEQSKISTLLKEICAFANYNGGKIIIGIKEDKDHNPSDFSDTGVNEITFEKWEQSLRSKLSVSIIPSLYGIKLEYIVIDKDKNCIVIDVPRSVIKPHAFNTGSNHEFYIRNGNTSIRMKYNDLKNSFDALNLKQQKLEFFRDDRIASILNDEIDESLTTSPLLLIHIYPEISLDESTYINLINCETNLNLELLNNNGISRYRNYNADGFMKSERDNNGLLSYIQIFTNGVLEIGENHLMNRNINNQSNFIFFWDSIEKIMAKKFYNYCNELNSQNLGTSFYISFTILNAKGYRSMTSESYYYTETINKNIIKSNIIKWNINDSYEQSMYQLFNKFANIFGNGESSLYEHGIPIEKRFDFLNE